MCQCEIVRDENASLLCYETVIAVDTIIMPDTDVEPCPIAFDVRVRAAAHAEQRMFATKTVKHKTHLFRISLQNQQLCKLMVMHLIILFHLGLHHRYHSGFSLLLLVLLIIDLSNKSERDLDFDRQSLVHVPLPFRPNWSDLLAELALLHRKPVLLDRKLLWCWEILLLGSQMSCGNQCRIRVRQCSTRWMKYGLRTYDR